ncbi:MAG: hypothetical protein AAFW73_24670 [Bacteroidota bacterium]
MKSTQLWALLFVALAACNTGPATETSGPEPFGFFDLKAYIAEEVEKLERLEGKITKTTQIDGQSESHTFDSLDFAQELSVFASADINRPAWLDQYRVDSIRTPEGDLRVLEYRAIREDLPTQRIRVEFEEEMARIIQIEKLTENALMSASLQLEYHSGQSYRIQSKQQLKLSEEREMVVEVKLPES